MIAFKQVKKVSFDRVDVAFCFQKSGVNNSYY